MARSFSRLSAHWAALAQSRLRSSRIIAAVIASQYATSGWHGLSLLPSAFEIGGACQHMLGSNGLYCRYTTANSCRQGLLLEAYCASTRNISSLDHPPKNAVPVQPLSQPRPQTPRSRISILPRTVSHSFCDSPSSSLVHTQATLRAWKHGSDTRGARIVGAMRHG
ncbi:hypothetical protein BDV95DRAFT_591169 [Massariosphaeria phaeospora]|uniref:Uncharacterized protein n=1 Tax=Massariosphaeria phaeospora TaxID=100035 RepID=A0A7C8MV30_9PLEO|nr:hypothetical protein BDV95DRAFT_591169 [Massariosphaeria phaeospora]